MHLSFKKPWHPGFILVYLWKFIQLYVYWANVTHGNCTPKNNQNGKILTTRDGKITKTTKTTKVQQGYIWLNFTNQIPMVLSLLGHKPRYIKWKKEAFDESCYVI